MPAFVPLPSGGGSNSLTSGVIDTTVIPAPRERQNMLMPALINFLGGAASSVLGEVIKGAFADKNNIGVDNAGNPLDVSPETAASYYESINAQNQANQRSREGEFGANRRTDVTQAAEDKRNAASIAGYDSRQNSEQAFKTEENAATRNFNRQQQTAQDILAQEEAYQKNLNDRLRFAQTPEQAAAIERERASHSDYANLVRKFASSGNSSRGINEFQAGSGVTPYNREAPVPTGPEAEFQRKVAAYVKAGLSLEEAQRRASQDSSGGTNPPPAEMNYLDKAAYDLMLHQDSNPLIASGKVLAGPMLRNTPNRILNSSLGGALNPADLINKYMQLYGGIEHGTANFDANTLSPDSSHEGFPEMLQMILDRYSK